MTTQLRRSPRLAAAREKAAAPPQPGRMERLLIGDAAPSFALLAIASVSMTLGNKWLMLRPELKAHIELVVVLQNSAAVCVAAGLALLGVVQIRSVSRRQLLYFGWDALVLGCCPLTMSAIEASEEQSPRGHATVSHLSTRQTTPTPTN